jgi:hypothetical protein
MIIIVITIFLILSGCSLNKKPTIEHIIPEEVIEIKMTDLNKEIKVTDKDEIEFIIESLSINKWRYIHDCSDCAPDFEICVIGRNMKSIIGLFSCGEGYAMVIAENKKNEHFRVPKNTYDQIYSFYSNF